MVALVYVGVSVCVFFLQRSMLYHPSGEAVLPSELVYPGLSEVEVQTEDGVRLLAWYWPNESGAAILVLHGNAGNRSGRLQLMRRLHKRGFSVMVPDYRGFGGSEGSPSEEGLLLDAAASARWLAKNNGRDIVYFGESLGTGVAVALAREQPPRALVLQSPFDSMVSAGQHHYPYLPVSWLLLDRYKSDEIIGRVRCPILFLHGERDQIVPYELGRALYERAREPKRWVGEPKAGHNDLRSVMGDRFYDEIESFLADKAPP